MVENFALIATVEHKGRKKSELVGRIAKLSPATAAIDTKRFSRKHITPRSTKDTSAEFTSVLEYANTLNQFVR